MYYVQIKENMRVTKTDRKDISPQNSSWCSNH